MGLATLHNHNTVNTPIKPMNNSPATGDKKALLDSLYKMNSNNGTPLRNALRNAGKYLDCDSSPWFPGACPRLALSDGGACQQNFVVLMTDGFYNGSFSSFGNHDGDDSSSWDGRSYADGFSETLADIAIADADRPEPLDSEALVALNEKPRIWQLDASPACKRQEIPSGFDQAIPGILMMFTLLVLLTSGGSMLV